MAGRFWNTLAVEDVERSRRFYEGLGFTVRDAPGGPSCITVHPDDSTLICLFPKTIFAGMVPKEICDTGKSNELVQSYAADSREQVDDLLTRAGRVGGKVLGAAKDLPFGYVGGFTDPDGHVWAVLHMPGQ